MRRRCVLMAGLVLFCVLTGVGCGPAAPKYVQPTWLAPGEAAYLTRPKNTTLFIVKIDGGVTPRPRPTWDDMFGGERFVLRPGVHNVVCRYQEGNVFSMYHAEVTFAAEPGHTYHLSDWPPDLLDITESKTNAKPVPHKVRLLKPNE